MSRIDIGNNIINPKTVPATVEGFYQAADDARTRLVCADLEEALQAYEGGALTEKEYKRLKTARKRACYFYTPHAHFQKGYKSREGEPVDSGKAVIDLDGCRNFEALYELRLKGREQELGIDMVNRSVSGTGGHVLFEIPQGMTRQQAQAWMAHELGDVAYDKAVHELERAIYIPCRQYILYINEHLMFEAIQQPPLPALPEGREYIPSHAENTQDASVTTPFPREGHGDGVSFRGIPYSTIISEFWQRTGGVPQEGERNVRLYQLAANLRSICDNRKDLLMQVMPRLGLSEQELQGIVDSACKEPPKGISKMLQSILEMENGKLKNDNGTCPASAPSLTGRAGGESSSSLQGRAGGESVIDTQLWTWGKEIEALFDHFPTLSDVCKGLKQNQYPAALFVAGGFMMTLMTRCTYRFYHRREEQRRLNNSTFIIGDPASGKSFATRLYRLLCAPLFEADRPGMEAIKAYREQMQTKGANKDKPKKPEVVIRVHPARTSNAQFIRDMVNAVEEVDGQKMQLHMLTFDTELDNTLSVQKGGSWIDKQTMELKAFHNEEDGQAYGNNDSVYEKFDVTWNFIYTGTPIALKKKVNAQNFGSGLATRLTCIPLPSTNFQMMEWEEKEDSDSDRRLSEWAAKLDRMKGELSVQRLVRELYDWTARRMADANDNDSKADEMLLKRCAYHGLNFAAPFIVMRHWADMKQDGTMWCGQFETDEVDWQLAELICNIQYACQRHYFGRMAEKYFEDKDKEAAVNLRRNPRTIENFNRLPEEFTTEDVMRCFNLKSEAAARSRTSRLLRDHVIQKLDNPQPNDTPMAHFRKTGIELL